MPRKIRQLKADLRKEGFTWRPGKGSHQVWFHPRLPAATAVLPGQDGRDARDYLEDEVREALAKVRDALGEQQ